MSNSERYTRTAIVLHWAIAVLATVQFSWGWWMQGIDKVPQGPRVDAFNLHKSVGLTILLLMVVRVLWRVFNRPPPLLAIPRWQSRFARGTHIGMYVALFVLPLSGYLGSVFSGYPVKYFGRTLPAWDLRDAVLKDLMSAVHFWAGCTLGALVALHITGVLKHALIDRDGLLGRLRFEQ